MGKSMDRKRPVVRNQEGAWAKGHPMRARDRVLRDMVINFLSTWAPKWKSQERTKFDKELQELLVAYGRSVLDHGCLPGTEASEEPDLSQNKS